MEQWSLLADIPMALGPLGTVIAFLVILAQTILNFFAWRKSTEAAHLKGAVAAMDAELKVYKSKADRQESEIKELRTEHENCTKQLERVTKWYLEAKGEEEDERRPRKRSREGAGNRE